MQPPLPRALTPPERDTHASWCTFPCARRDDASRTEPVSSDLTKTNPPARYPTADNDFVLDFIKMTSELDPDDEHVLMICGHAKPSACAEAVAHAGAPEDHPCGPSDAATPEAAAATGAFCEVLLANHTATEHGELLLHGAARVESVATAHDAAIAAGEMPEVPTIHLEIVDADDFAEMMNLAKETVASLENPVELEAARIGTHVGTRVGTRVGTHGAACHAASASHRRRHRRRSRRGHARRHRRRLAIRRRRIRIRPRRGTSSRAKHGDQPGVGGELLRQPSRIRWTTRLLQRSRHPGRTLSARRRTLTAGRDTGCAFFSSYKVLDAAWFRVHATSAPSRNHHVRWILATSRPTPHRKSTRRALIFDSSGILP